MTPAQQWRDRLRESLPTALKARDTARVVAIRSALSAIDNAEACDAVPVATAGPIAGAASGLYAAEAARRVLSERDIRDLIQLEIDGRLSAADEYIANGYHVRASDLRSQAAVLGQTLRDVG